MGLGLGNANANNFVKIPPGSAPPPPPFSNLYSVHFNGTDQSLQNTTISPLLGTGGTGDWSVSFWVKADTMSGIGNQRMWSFGAGGSQQTQLYINNSGNLQFAGPWSDGFTWGVAAGTWAHVIYRVNRASASLNVGYVLNGSTFNNKNQSITTTFDTTGATYVGRNSGSFGFEGNIDELAVWNKYLSNADCLEIYNGGSGVDLTTLTPAANLQHWWRMGDPTGTASYPTITDAAGSIDLTMVNQASSDIETDVP